MVQRARSLLAPGGVLAIIEAVRPHRWLDITFGLTEGWWKFEDTDLRPVHPLLTSDRWLTVLRGAGFDDVAHATTANAGSGPLAAQALLLARAPLQAEAAGSRAATNPGRWLIVADGGGVGTALADRIRATGGEPVVVAAPLSADGGAHVEQSVLAAGSEAAGATAPLRQVVYLSGLDAPPASVTTAGELQAFAARTCAGAMHLTRALRAAGVAAPLWIATRHAQHVRAAAHLDMRLAAAPLWGFGRVIGLEHPDLWGGLIDVDGAPAAATADVLFGEILGS